MVSTAKIKHKKTYSKPLLPQHFHPYMKDNKMMLEDRGLTKVVDYALQIKVYGDPDNTKGEEHLRMKFERTIKNLKMGDGRTQIKVSELYPFGGKDNE